MDLAKLIVESAIPYNPTPTRPHLGDGLWEFPSAVFSEACRITTENPPENHGPLPPP